MGRGKSINVYLIDGEATGKIQAKISNWNGIAYKTFMPRILGTTINETYMGHDWVFSCLP